LNPERASRSAAALLVASLWSAGCSDSGEPGQAAPDAAATLRGDRRVADLLGGCAQSGFYDRDLSDPVPILIAKLERGRPEALKRAKEELGQLGAQAFPALGHAFQANYTDLMRSAFLENVVDSLAFNASDEAHELLLEALRHPQESVRMKALDGLTRQPRAGDFDVLSERLAIETAELRRQTVGTLFEADRVRAEALFLGYIERGEERPLWILAAPQFAETRDAENARRCGELYPGLEPLLAPHLAVAAARAGDERALDSVRASARAEELTVRLATVTALQRAGLVDELAWTLREDPSGDARAIAAAALAGAEPSPTRREWLRGALSDPHGVVQSEALDGLCAQEDPEGLARALAQLDGEAQALTQALTALRVPLQRSPELARSALERLRERHALEEHRPLQQRVACLKGIGQVPLAEAAAFLRTLALGAGAERIESLRAHDWLMIQASNTGIPGRRFLAEQLAGEEDPLRRLDLIDAVASTRDELARDTLLALVEGTRSTPLEKLFAASVLIKVGPSWDVAPRLKRVAFALEGPQSAEARAGLQCLLWLWY
jgi:hypothetical protein